MKHFAKLLQPIAFLVLAAVSPSPATAAQTNYENYSFTTLAGPAESGIGWYDGPGSTARFYHPAGVATDTGGNVYVADANNHLIRKITSGGMVMTVAGLAGSLGANNGTGSAARFNFPDRAAVDSSGNLYVADTDNHTIRKITPGGVVTTFAGLAGVPGTSNGKGSAARFNSPYGVALDRGGNLYVADTANSTIRKITSSGVVSTLAGLATFPGTNDGAGPVARFYYPYGVAIDGSSNVYVADYGNSTIRKITAAGVVTTLAGLAGSTGTTNDTGSAARFYQPCGVTVDGGGTLYVADTYNHTIRMVTSGGVVTTLAGSPGNSGSADGTGSAAQFFYPFDVAVDSSTNVYVADIYNNTIRKVTPTGVVTTVAGAPGGSGSTNAAGNAARFNFPAAVAVDNGGNVYVADLANDIIRKITSDGVVTTLAGMAGNSGNADGTNSDARFNQPVGVAVDGSSNVYVADTYNFSIRRITPDGVVTTLAGTNQVGSTNGIGGDARFNLPSGIAVDSSTNVYVADTHNHTIRKITPDGVVTTLAGTPGSSGSADGTNSDARFYFPFGVAVDANGNVFVADEGNNEIRKITPAGVVTTLAGSTTSGSSDGVGTNAHFNFPFGAAVDANGNVYVADEGNSTIRKITPGGVVTTLAGTPGSSGNADGSGSAVSFNTPEGVAVDTNGNVYVGDTSNHSIRKGAPSLPDSPVVNPPIDHVGFIRHLDVTNLTTTSWSWSFIRYPAASSAQLSSTTARNPTLTPDVSDLYVLRFEGMDNSGRVVISTVPVVVDSTPPTAVTLSITGQGTVSPNYSNALLQIGQTYTITARPAAGYVFNGWTGDIIASSAKLTFTMQNYLTLHANFIPNPFGPVIGTYQGLFYDTNGLTPQSSGFFSATVMSSGAFSAKLQSGATKYSLSGQFLGSGLASNSIPVKNSTPLSVQLQLDLAGGNAITGLISNNAAAQPMFGFPAAELFANRNIYSKTNPPPQMGKYTLLIPGSADSSTQPGGDSFGTVTVDGSGNVTLAGTLGDGTKLSEKTILSAQGQWPFYVPVYSGNGMVLGWMTITNELTNDIGGLVTWIKLAQASKLYPGGFTNQTGAMGSVYLFTNTVPVLNFTTGQVSLVNGNLAAAITNQVVLGANSKVTGTNKLSLTITTTTGLFKGSVPDPASGKTVSFNGVLLQRQEFGAGFFLGTNQSGRVFFGP